jgi:cysteinyl-tRNA synthetase
MTEAERQGLEKDVREFLQKLDGRVLDLTQVIGAVNSQTLRNADHLAAQDTLMVKIERHLSEINGNCKSHTATLAEHDTALALLEQRTVCALDKDCRLKEAIAKVPEVAATVENATILSMNIRENWLKWLLALLLVGATSAGGSWVGRL